MLSHLEKNVAICLWSNFFFFCQPRNFRFFFLLFTLLDLFTETETRTRKAYFKFTLKSFYLTEILKMK